MSEIGSGPTLINAHFFFVDIVGLSDPDMSTKTQIKKINVLNRCISECEAYRNTPEQMALMLPTGDGMCLGFLQGPEFPLNLAIQLQKKLDQYNMAKIPSEIVRVRIGLHSGNCFIVSDLRGNKNIWGPGIILSRRVMDFGDDGHILMSPMLADQLRELSDEYKKIIKPVHDFVIKHGTTMLIYSAYDGKSFGNSKHPSKGEAFRSKIGEEVLKMQKTTLYPSIEISMKIVDPKTMMVHHKRKYEIANISDKPIFNVLHGVATDVEKYSINDLNLKIYDQDNKELVISSINVDKPNSKEFTTMFNKPIKKEDEGQFYTIEYDLEEPERYFANAFLIDCNKMSISIEYPDDPNLKEPVLYDINQETEEKTVSETKPKVEKVGSFNKMTWGKTDITKGETFKLEW